MISRVTVELPSVYIMYLHKCSTLLAISSQVIKNSEQVTNMFLKEALVISHEL